MELGSFKGLQLQWNKLSISTMKLLMRRLKLRAPPHYDKLNLTNKSNLLNYLNKNKKKRDKGLKRSKRWCWEKLKNKMTKIKVFS